MNRKILRSFAIATMFGGIVFLLQLVASGHGRDEPLVVTRLILVDSRAVDRHLTDDIYRAGLTHTGGPGSGDFAMVSARIAYPLGFWAPGFLQIVDGDVDFGTVRAGETVESRDTVTIRRHRNHPLKTQQLRWAVSGRADLVLSDAWAGNWRFTITSSDPDTNHVAAIDDITDSLGAGEPVGFSLLPELVRCEWAGSDRRLEANCRTRFRFAGCLADGSAHFMIERNDDAIDGHGQWEVTATGDCGPNTGTGGESIEIEGVRLTAEAEPEPFSPGVFTKLATTPTLAGLLSGRVSDTASNAPTSEVDCDRGRWRRLSNPWFRSVQACHVFVRSHRDRRNEGRR